MLNDVMLDESDAQLREQLIAAIHNVRRQIGIQSTADHYVGSGRITAAALTELRAELTQLEQALAEVKSGD